MTLKHVGTQSLSPELRRLSGEAGSEHADSGRTSASTSGQVKFLEINCKFQPGEWLGICAAHAGEASAPRTPHAVLTPPPTPQAALHVPRPRSNRQSRPLTPSPLPPAPPDAPRDPLCISEFVSVSVVLILSPGVHVRVKSHGIGLFCPPHSTRHRTLPVGPPELPRTAGPRSLVRLREVYPHHPAFRRWWAPRGYGH